MNEEKTTENFENMSFFDDEKIKGKDNRRLDIVEAQYLGQKIMTWEELFNGYDTIRAITFSASIPFISKVIEKYENAEIIFGLENVLSEDISTLIAYQDNLIERIRKESSKSKEYLLSRIDDKTLKLFVARQKTSHEKIYLLSSKSGKTRVIVGSANMSYNAFNATQRENIIIFDDKEAFGWYLDCFNNYKDKCSDSITHKAILIADQCENIDEIPVMNSAKNATKAIILEPTVENDEEARFIIKVNDDMRKLAEALPKQNKNTKGFVLNPQAISIIRRRVIEDKTEKKRIREQLPQLTMNIDEQTAALNENKLDLSPLPDKVKEDCKCFIDYLESCKNFHGDSKGMQYRYYEFFNFVFCSPFMAQMREEMHKLGRQPSMYPIFGLLYGQSKAGKTTFLKIMLKMMIGQTPIVSAPEFKKKDIDAIRRSVKGVPIIADDLTNTRFNQHAVEIIKNDEFGKNEHLKDYSAVIISANEDIKSVAPEVRRRTVICRVKGSLTDVETIKDNTAYTTQQRIGTALFREYLNRMLKLMPNLLIQAQNEGAEAPDLLAVSSEVIYSILKENIENLPEYVRTLTIEDYFDSTITAKNSIDAIKTAWEVNNKSFEIDKKKKELRYNTGDKNEANRLKKELPETLECEVSKETIIMNLDEAKKVFGIDFKNKFFSL